MAGERSRRMKDSGVEWIGEIPEGWSICKIKHRFAIYSGATPKSENMEYWDGEIPWITPADYKTTDKYVKKGRKNLTQSGFDSCGTSMIPAGSIVFSKRAPVGTVAISKNSLCTNQGCLSCVPKRETNSLFYYYAMSVFTEQFELVSSGTTFKEISADAFANFCLPNPTFEEQCHIAAYLDAECAKIDDILSKTRASIEEYKRLKQAVITQAVAKGVRGDRRMKESGIEWIGQVPEEWEIERLKFHWRSVESGVSVNAADHPTTDQDQYGVLKTSSVSKFVFRPEEHKQVNAEEYGRVACPVRKDTIIVSRMNTPDLVGACGYVAEDRPNLFLPDRLWMISFQNKFSAKFAWYYLCSNGVRDHIASLSTGTSHSMQNVSREQIGNMHIPIPDMNEQREIETYLDIKCAGIEKLIEKREQLVLRLEEYKRALIYECVTGKRGCQN